MLNCCLLFAPCRAGEGSILVQYIDEPGRDGVDGEGEGRRGMEWGRGGTVCHVKLGVVDLVQAPAHRSMTGINRMESVCRDTAPRRRGGL